MPAAADDAALLWGPRTARHAPAKAVSSCCPAGPRGRVATRTPYRAPVMWSACGKGASGARDTALARRLCARRGGGYSRATRCSRQAATCQGWSRGPVQFLGSDYSGALGLLCPKGAAYQSPGLSATADYPGYAVKETRSTPQGLRRGARTQPRWGRRPSPHLTQGSGNLAATLGFHTEPRWGTHMYLSSHPWYSPGRQVESLAGTHYSGNQADGVRRLAGAC